MIRKINNTFLKHTWWNAPTPMPQPPMPFYQYHLPSFLPSFWLSVPSRTGTDTLHPPTFAHSDSGSGGGWRDLDDSASTLRIAPTGAQGQLNTYPRTNCTSCWWYHPNDQNRFPPLHELSSCVSCVVYLTILIYVEPHRMGLVCHAPPQVP